MGNVKIPINFNPDPVQVSTYVKISIPISIDPNSGCGISIPTWDPDLVSEDWFGCDK
jgi:hypothetical protein